MKEMEAKPLFEIKVTVEIPGLPEAINKLAEAMQGTACHCTNETPGTQAPIAFVNPTPVQQIPVPDNGVIAAPFVPPVSSVNAPTPAVMPTAPEAAVAPSPVVEPPCAATAPSPAAPAPVPTPAPAAPSYTMDDIGRAGATLIDAGKMPQLIALLGKFGVQAVTQLKPEQFAPFAEELKSLGAKF